MGYFTGHEEDRDRARRKGGSDGGTGSGFIYPNTQGDRRWWESKDKKCSIFQKIYDAMIAFLLMPILIAICMCAVHPSKSFDKKAWKNG